MALIRPLAWELPYAVGEALKRPKKKQKTKNKKNPTLFIQKVSLLELTLPVLYLYLGAQRHPVGYELQSAAQFFLNVSQRDSLC